MTIKTWIKKVLNYNFPSVAFKIIKNKRKIIIAWVDGPSLTEVEELTNEYQSRILELNLQTGEFDHAKNKKAGQLTVDYIEHQREYSDDVINEYLAQEWYKTITEQRSEAVAYQELRRELSNKNLLRK